MPEKDGELPEDELERLEGVLPRASGIAFAAARARVLASGQSLLQSEGGVIDEVFPDGRRRFVKSIEPLSCCARLVPRQNDKRHTASIRPLRERVQFISADVYP